MESRNEERAAFLATAQKFAQWIAKRSREAEWAELAVRRSTAEFDWETAREAGRAGLLHAVLPEDLGGSDLDPISQVTMIEAVAEGGAAMAEVLAVHWSALRALARADGAREWLNQAVNRETDQPMLTGIAYPRSVVSQDQEMAAAKAGASGLAVTGEWICPLHPGLCERVVMAIPTEDGEAAAWVAGAELAPHVRDIHPGSGLLEIPMAAVRLDALPIPSDAIIIDGDTSRDLKTSYYLGLAAAMVGNAQAAAAYAREYAGERVQTGRPIIAHQDVLRVIESMEVRLDAAGAVVMEAARSGGLDRARRAYLAAGDATEAVCQDAVQTLGGYGYMKDYGLEMRLRDLKTLQCLTGAHALEVIGESF